MAYQQPYQQIEAPVAPMTYVQMPEPVYEPAYGAPLAYQQPVVVPAESQGWSWTEVSLVCGLAVLGTAAAARARPSAVADLDEADLESALTGRPVAALAVSGKGK